MIKNIIEFKPQLINIGEISFPFFFTKNSLKLRVMLDINARTNQLTFPV